VVFLSCRRALVHGASGRAVITDAQRDTSIADRGPGSPDSCLCSACNDVLEPSGSCPDGEAPLCLFWRPRRMRDRSALSFDPNATAIGRTGESGERRGSAAGPAPLERLLRRRPDSLSQLYSTLGRCGIRGTNVARHTVAISRPPPKRSGISRRTGDVAEASDRDDLCEPGRGAWPLRLAKRWRSVGREAAAPALHESFGVVNPAARDGAWRIPRIGRCGYTPPPRETNRRRSDPA